MEQTWGNRNKERFPIAHEFLIPLIHVVEISEQWPVVEGQSAALSNPLVVEKMMLAIPKSTMISVQPQRGCLMMLRAAKR